MAIPTAIVSGLFILILVIFISMNLESMNTIPIPMPNVVRENFESFTQPVKYDPGIACGVDLPECSEDKRCINGFCKGVTIPPLPETGLPIVP